MTNQIILKGIIKNIQPSHTINDIEYDKATLLVLRENGKEDTIEIKFKKFSNPYQEGQTIDLIGNIRSYSKQLESGKNKVDIYVFTYFDHAETETDVVNSFEVEGRICKIEPLRLTLSGKHNIHFILANNIVTNISGLKLNNYLPCVVWGLLAKQTAEYNVNDFVKIQGELHSREYKKELPDGNIEFHVAHELIVLSIENIDE